MPPAFLKTHYTPIFREIQCIFCFEADVHFTERDDMETSVSIMPRELPEKVPAKQ